MLIVLVDTLRKIEIISFAAMTIVLSTSLGPPVLLHKECPSTTCWSFLIPNIAGIRRLYDADMEQRKANVLTVSSYYVVMQSKIYLLNDDLWPRIDLT